MPTKHYCQRCGGVLLGEHSVYLPNRVMYICHQCHLHGHYEDFPSKESALEHVRAYYRVVYPPLLKNTADQFRQRSSRSAKYMRASTQ